MWRVPPIYACSLFLRVILYTTLPMMSVISVYIILLLRVRSLCTWFILYYCNNCYYYINAVCKSVKSKAEQSSLLCTASGENSRNETLVAHKHKYIIYGEERVEYVERLQGEAFFFVFLFFCIYIYSFAPYIIIKSVNPRTLPWSRRDVN